MVQVDNIAGPIGCGLVEDFLVKGIGYIEILICTTKNDLELALYVIEQ